MKIVSYNVQYGLGKDQRMDLERIAESVRGADVIALQEVERNWARPEYNAGPQDQPEILSALLPDYFWVYHPAFDVDASEKDRDGRVINRRRQHGVMLLARTPIKSSKLIPLPKVVHYDLFNMQMGALEAVIYGASGPLRVYVVHLGYLTSAERLDQIETLLASIASAPEQGGAWSGLSQILADNWLHDEAPPPMPYSAVVLGDFNSTWDSPEYGRITKDGGHPALVDSWTALGQDIASGVTRPARASDSYPQDRRIDYCFVTPDLVPTLEATRIDSDAQGSDHQPVWLELNA